MPDIDTDQSTTASPPGGDSPGPGLSGQSTPSPAAQPAGEGAPPPTPTAQAGGAGNMQAGLLAYGRHLAGTAVSAMDMAIRILPSGEDRDLLIKHYQALSKHFKSQSPLQGGAGGAGRPGAVGVPQPPGAGGPSAQPGTPNLPRGPIPMPQAPGGLNG